ncbi:hypothetical protein [Plantactinospora sp. WMMB782]|uniref:hypothetical protein n=1 Tax=Plantactinospora sp. WMMB782 TaxID=3404121 RepID=UPI003B94F226
MRHALRGAGQVGLRLSCWRRFLPLYVSPIVVRHPGVLILGVELATFGRGSGLYVRIY